MNCPYCCSMNVNYLGSGKYECSACLRIFSDEDKKNNLSKKRLGINNNDNKLKANLFSTQGKKDGAQIYSQSIKNVAIISCIDLGSTGTGFLDKTSKKIITNAHVVLDEYEKVSHNIIVNIGNFKTKGRVLCYGNIRKLDVAVIEVYEIPYECDGLVLGDSNGVKIGDEVYTIGNSLGQGLCITKGIISDTNRYVGDCECFMADVAANKGNSGGPLLNCFGEVIAFCVAGIEKVQGMCYFIPINKVKKYL